MKKLLIASAIAASTVSMYANAESKFEGFSLELGVASVDYTSKPNNLRSPANPTNLTQLQDVSARESFVDVGIKYTFKLSPKMYLALSYERGLGDADIGRNFTAAGVSIDSITVIDNLESFIIAPSYAFNESTLASVRVGYIRNDFSLKDIDPAEPTVNYDQKGYSLGFGAQHFITDNLYVGGSFDVSFYDEETYTASSGNLFDLDTDATKLRLNVGYKF
jgi:opacity protein-like surface antigen